MADDTLASLQFFKDSLNQLATQRALNTANDEVNRIKTEVTDEGQQRSMLQALANHTALRLQGLGNNTQQVAMAMHAIGPQEFSGADQEFLHGLNTGNQFEQTNAQTAMKESSKIELARIKAAAGADPFKQQVKRQAMQAVFEKELRQADTKVDENTSRFGNMAQIAQNLVQIGKLRSQIADPASMTEPVVREVAASMDRLFSNAAPTQTGTEHLSPNLNERYFADKQGWATNTLPKLPKTGKALAETLSPILDRLEAFEHETIGHMKSATVLARAQSLAKLDPDSGEQVKNWARERTGRELVFDSKTKSADFQDSLDLQDKLKTGLEQAAKEGDTKLIEAARAKYGRSREWREVMRKNAGLRKLNVSQER